MGIILFFMVLLLHQSTTHPSIQSANNKDIRRQTTEHDDIKDKENGKQIIGSSNVPPSVSVILNGEEPQFTDAVGQPIPKPQIPLQVASPINLLNPDRYEFYTFDDNGQLVKRLMTIKEIQSIVANGDGEGATVLHNSEIDESDPEKNVQDIVASVQHVLHKQVEENKNSSEQQQQSIMLDTPDVSSSWSMILPAIFGNTGGDIFPQNRPQQVVMTPDSDVVEPTKPSKRKQKPKPTKRKTTTTTEIPSSSSSLENVNEVPASIAMENIKPLFNRNEMKTESSSTDSTKTSITTQKTTTTSISSTSTKRKTKPKPTKTQNVQINETTTKKSSSKRKPTTTREPTVVTTKDSAVTIPTTKKATTKRKHTTKTPSTVTLESAVLNSQQPINKHKTNATRLPTVSNMSPGNKLTQTAPTKSQTKRKPTKTTLRPTSSSISITKSQHSTSVSVSSTTSHTTQKIQPSSLKKKIPTTTTLPVAYSVLSTTPKKKTVTKTTTAANTTKRNKNKNKISTTVSPNLGSQFNDSPTKVVSDVSQAIKSKPTEKISITSTSTSNNLPDTNEIRQPSSSTPSISYDMLSGQDAATTLSLNAIMNSLTQPQNDIKTQLLLDKLMDSLKDDAALDQQIKNLTNNNDMVTTTHKVSPTSSTPMSEFETTTFNFKEETTPYSDDLYKEKSKDSTTILPISLNESLVELQNGENIVRIEPLFAELLDPILTDLTTTENPDLTTTENILGSDTTSYESPEYTESIQENDATRFENVNNYVESSTGSSEFSQKVDEFINENLDTAETGVPIKEFTNKLSDSQTLTHSDSKYAMSDFIKDAATVASILEDNTKKPILETSSSNEFNNSEEIKSLLTDVISQMTNNPTMTRTPSTSKPINFTSPIFYANQPLNQKQSYIQNNKNSLNMALALESETNEPPSQELTPQSNSNDKFHEMETLSLQLNKLSNESRENFDENIHDMNNNNKLQTISTTSMENSALNDDENDSEIDVANDANNLDNIKFPNIKNTTSDTVTENTFSEKSKENINKPSDFTKPDILLSTPVTTKDDTILITTLMASMAAGSVMATTSPIPFENTQISDNITEAFTNKDNLNSLEISQQDASLFSKEKDMTTVPSFTLDENSSTSTEVDNNNSSESNINEEDNNEGDDVPTQSNSSIEDKTTMMLSQDNNVNILQETTELPLHVTTIFYSDESTDSSTETKNILKEQDDKDDKSHETNIDENITMRPSTYYNESDEDVMMNKSSPDESDESLEYSNEMSTIKVADNDSIEASLESITIAENLDDDSSEVSTTIENKTEKNSEINDLLSNTMIHMVSQTPIKPTLAQKHSETEESYVKLGESTKPMEEKVQVTENPEHKPLTNDAEYNKYDNIIQSTTKRVPSTLKPVHYFKPPITSTSDQKHTLYNATQQRPIIRPPALSNLKVTQLSQVTRPPVKLDPTPEKSLGLEASVMDLQEDIQEFARLCNELAFSYWRSITSEKISSARSLVISPFALTSMLSMVFLGARGSTSGEMNEILRLDDMVTFNPHLVFKNITESVERAKDSGIASSAFVRELFSDRNNGKILQFFKDKVHQFYSGHVEEVNFNVVNDIIRRRTNLLIKRHANGKVMEYLRTNSVWVNGPLSTVSANLFQTDCSKASTIDRDGEMFFQVSPSVRQRRLIPIPAVVYRNGFTAGYDSELDATAVAFGSADETVSTIYVMPGQHGLAMPGDNLEHLEKNLMTNGISKNAWTHLLTSLMERPGLEIQLPRFSHRSFINASLGLQKLGLKALFNSDEADLRGLTGSSQKDIHLADMIQINTFSTCGEEKISDHHHIEMYPAPPLRKRNSDLSEYDSDDQAALSEMHIDFGSIVQDAGRSLYDDLLDPKYLEVPLPLRPRQARIPDSPRLRLDKPFIYFVRHNPTGMILFMGRFNPRLLP
ncbi:mucin-2 [Condylostylus longicornis]|uniref:mucin-2 n=1 Tax=Condylostylus longicornis TaxID=2530218 RepID=UPI00244E2F30|nr:mucin-2 [Condylostylus longicornis]